MSQAQESKYVRRDNKSALVRRWIAKILLQSDLRSHLMFSGLDPAITAKFDASSFNKENREDPDFIRAWLEDRLAECGNESIDESDVFAINTRRLQKAMGLNKVELAVFRFACLLAGSKALQSASELGTGDYAETDACDIVSELLELPFDRIYSALRPSGMLRKSGLIRVPTSWHSTQHLTRWLMIPEPVAREIFRHQDDANLMMNALYRVGPKSELTMHDFSQRNELSLMKDYLRGSFREKAVGANILIWGPPGTGKTQMARHLAQALRKKSLEINSVGFEGEAITAAHRLDSYRFCQAILARTSNAIVVFDEVEEILCSDSFSRFGFKEKGEFTKGLVNSILETNRTPAIWVTNTVDGVDPAYLRRFDIVVNVDTPPRLIKKKLAWRTFRDLPIQQSVVDRMVQHDGITPAHMRKVTRICERLGVETPEHAASIARRVLNEDLKAVYARPLEPRKKNRGIRRKALPYRPELINCDTDVATLAENLSADSSVRICAFGPPGTGKSAWARHLADKVGRPLIVKHAADILDKYIGGTERNIAAAFNEARDSNSILMLDEVDSFLPDRANAVRHWEITQANQFLTAMEEFAGILVCATNLDERLDPAALRRFDFKIHFDYLGPEDACRVADDLLKIMGASGTDEERQALLNAIDGLQLSHGDFAALLRRYSAMKTRPTYWDVAKNLKAEAGFRRPNSRPIGFTADIH